MMKQSALLVRTPVALGVLLVGMFYATPALAAFQAYPWCALYMMRGSARNCGFVSFEQCLADVSGIGGFCQQNPYYVAPAPKPRVRKMRPRHHIKG